MTDDNQSKLPGDASTGYRRNPFENETNPEQLVASAAATDDKDYLMNIASNDSDPKAREASANMIEYPMS